MIRTLAARLIDLACALRNHTIERYEARLEGERDE